MSVEDFKAKASRERANKALAKDKGPTMLQQTGAAISWQKMYDTLGQPFDSTSIPLSKLQQMRRDPMIAFALMYCKVPLIRAPWYIQCSDSQIAAFVDNALRAIYGSFILQYTNCFDFGYQAIVKRFELTKPDWEYIDKDTGDLKKVWDSENVDALVWKNFVALTPELVNPVWTDNGDFNGIEYSNASMLNVFALNQDGTGRIIDLDYALWVVNDKQSVFGSLWGYPRIGHAYRYWWSYWYTWALSDKHYEKDADPPTIVRYPQKRMLDDDTGEEIDTRSVALSIGEDLRSGSTVAMSSDAVQDYDGKSTGKYEWDISHLTTGGNFSAFIERFQYLDIMKMRSVMVPEHALVEGSGGCLLGDTPISMPRDHVKYPDGIPLQDVKPGQFVWSFNEEEGSFELRPVKSVFKTMEDAEVYKLTLDDGSEVIGTPDHPFLTRDGIWKEMIALKPGDQLMPFYEGARNNYYDNRKAAEGDFEPTIMLDPDNGKQIVEYRHVAQQFGWYDSDVSINVHHIDGRHANTDISNLQPLTLSEHAKKHFSDEHWKLMFSQKVKAAMANLDDETKSRLGKSHWTDEQWAAYKEKQREPGRESMVGYLDSLDSDERQEFLSNRTKAGWENGSRDLSTYEWKEKSCVNCDKMYTPTHSVQKYCTNCVEEARQNHIGRIKRHKNFAAKNCIKCSKSFDPSSGSQKSCFDCMKVAVNHKVVSVEKYGRSDVWDISIDGPEFCKNYVANGVVAHNTSSRNVADAMGDIFFESQAVVMSDIDDHINRYMIPQLVERNFPEFDGICKKVTRGFSQSDDALAKQIVQLVGQQDPDKLQVDVREILDQAGVPLLSMKQVQARQDEIASEQANSAPPDVEPKDGNAGVSGGKYIGGQDTVSMSFADSGDKLSDSSWHHENAKDKRFDDKAVKKSGDKLLKIWEKYYGDIYKSFSDFLKNYTLISNFDDKQDSKSLAEEVNAIMKAWTGLSLLENAVGESKAHQQDVMNYASVKELGDAGVKVGAGGVKWDANNKDAEDWIAKRGAELLANASDTTKAEIRKWLENNINSGDSPVQLSKRFGQDFADYPSWKAKRVVRTETRDAYNAGTLLSGKARGLTHAIASDASGGKNINTDQHCINRNGKRFTIDKALKEKDHPNGTLGWILVPSDVTLSEGFLNRIKSLFV